MNYRHAFHAGNFADILKHAILLRVARDLAGARAGLTVIDTHAGAGVYDLRGGLAARTGEAAAGVGRLMAAPGAPAVFDDLKAAVRRVNRGDETRFYPGSPLLIADALGPRDHLVACELRQDDHAALEAALPRRPGAEGLQADGWRVAPHRARAARGEVLVFVDPPYEAAGEAARAARLVGEVLAGASRATLLVWLPIKDLAGFDDAAGALADAADGAPLLLAETRLRGLDDPTRLNGCALAIVNPGANLAAAAAEAATWVAGTSGERGALGRAMFL